MRILVCKVCKTVEELPGFKGTPAEEGDDPLLVNVMSRHNHQLIMVGGPEADMMLMTVDDQVWKKNRFEILKEVKHRWTGFEPEVYAVKNTFQEDALRCYGRHHRPKEGCIDWLDSSKLLTPAWQAKDEDVLDKSDVQKVEEAILRSGVRQRKPIHLCNFCPVATYYTTRVRDARGMYDRQPGEPD